MFHYLFMCNDGFVHCSDLVMDALFLCICRLTHFSYFLCLTDLCLGVSFSQFFSLIFFFLSFSSSSSSESSESSKSCNLLAFLLAVGLCALADCCCCCGCTCGCYCCCHTHPPWFVAIGGCCQPCGGPHCGGCCGKGPGVLYARLLASDCH